MKKIAIGIAGMVILLMMGRTLTNKPKAPNLNQNAIQITNVPTPTHYELRTTNFRSLFVPYWSSGLSEKDREYDNYYYFGIRPTATGQIENEVGLTSMPKIVESLKLKPKNQKKAVLRMLDNDINEALLTSTQAQNSLIKEVNTILEQNNFSGIVLDVEIPFTLNTEKKGQITQFVQKICTGIKANYKTCDMLIYGDFSYRNRPFDLKALSRIVDRILLMTYDFHKAGGEPGPNFSYDEKQKYGYDFKQMVTDAITLVPKEKLEIVFGMYGYDWTLNEQGKPLKSAEALSLNEIESKVLKSEGLKVESNKAKEKSIQYIDSEGLNHIIWYEDEESAAIKTKYLQSVGIGKVSYWAYSYF
jgi:spore germination protein YaaH